MNNIFDKKYRLAHNYNTEGQSIYITFRGNFRNYLCGTGCIKTVSLGTTITGSIGIGPLLYFSYKS